MKRLLFVVLALALLLFFAWEAEEPAQREKGVAPPVLRVAVGETVVYESQGGIDNWRSGSSWLTGDRAALETLAERMEYDAVDQTQAAYTFTLPPNGMSVSCYQYIDGKLIPGETTLSETDGTLELLPGKWIYQITANWHSEAEDYVGSGTFTFGIDVQ